MKEAQPKPQRSFDEIREENLRRVGFRPRPEWERFAEKKFRFPNQFGRKEAPPQVVFRDKP